MKIYSKMTHIAVMLCTAMVCLLTIVNTSAGATQYTTVTLGGLGVAKAINNSNQVVGCSNAGYACIWDNGIITDLSTPGEISSCATAINNNGQVIGWSKTLDGNKHGFVWQGNVMTDLGGFIPTAINDNGQLVGTTGGNPSIREDATSTDLGTYFGNSWSATAINNQGQITGNAYIAGLTVTRPVLWQEESMTNLGTISGGNTYAYDINDDGAVVGFDFQKVSPYRSLAFLWTGEMLIQLATMDNWSSRAYGINNSGQVVGYSVPIGGQNDHAYLWQNGQSLDLGSGFNYSKANAINDNGWIVGSGNGQAVLWQPVPEPSSILALVCPLASLVGFAFKRKGR